MCGWVGVGGWVCGWVGGWMVGWMDGWVGKLVGGELHPLIEQPSQTRPPPWQSFAIQLLLHPIPWEAEWPMENFAVRHTMHVEMGAILCGA